MRVLKNQWPLHIAAVCLSAISLIYELSFCKIISKFTGNPVEWEALGMEVHFFLAWAAVRLFLRLEKVKYGS